MTADIKHHFPLIRFPAHRYRCHTEANKNKIIITTGLAHMITDNFKHTHSGTIYIYIAIASQSLMHWCFCCFLFGTLSDTDNFMTNIITTDLEHQ